MRRPEVWRIGDEFVVEDALVVDGVVLMNALQHPGVEWRRHVLLTVTRRSDALLALLLFAVPGNRAHRNQRSISLPFQCASDSRRTSLPLPLPSFSFQLLLILYLILQRLTYTSITLVTLTPIH